MIKTIYLFLFSFYTLGAMAQINEVFKMEQDKEFQAKEESGERAHPYPRVRGEDVLWYKEVYRIVDYREKANQPLYYPQAPTPERINFTGVLFDLLLSGKVPIYQYSLEVEDFQEENKLELEEDFLKQYGFTYEVVRDELTNAPATYVVPEYEIPYTEVKRVYLKEVWYYDKHSSRMFSRILAICPVWDRVDEDGNPQSVAIGWMKYSDLESHLAQRTLLYGNTGMVQTASFDAYLKNRKYNGFIYKEGSIQNRVLLDYVTNREEAKREQERIKSEIIEFEESLWEY